MNDQILYSSDRNYSEATASDGRRCIAKWPFAMMEVGDKIIIDDQAQHDNATSSYKYAARKYRMKFIRKTVDGKLWVKRTA